MYSNQLFQNLFIILTIIGQLWCQQISTPPGMTQIRNKHAYMADKGLMSLFATDCIYKRYPSSTHSRPSSQSMETLIDYIERLEDWLSNTTDTILSRFKNPEDVARLILQRLDLFLRNFFPNNNISRLDFIWMILISKNLNSHQSYRNV